MDADFWVRIHGATTHFPIALVLAGAAVDFGGWFAAGNQRASDGLHAAGYWMIILGGLGAIPAVASGLLMTHGELLGHGALLWHHVFVWAAFACLTGLAIWRWRTGPRPVGRGLAIYLAMLAVTAMLMTLAGYWGGEVALNT